jgi:hypothetical protein
MATVAALAFLSPLVAVVSLSSWVAVVSLGTGKTGSGYFASTRFIKASIRSI